MFLGEDAITLSSVQVWLLWLRHWVFISRTAELFKQITDMLPEEAVLMVYLQLREFRLPARGCHWKTVSKTFRIPQWLVISWSSYIPAQCNKPQVCLSLFILTEGERWIEAELSTVWDCCLFFQASGKRLVVLSIIDQGSVAVLLAYKFAAWSKAHQKQQRL